MQDKRNILYVEDDALSSFFIKTALAEYNIIIADSAERALEIFDDSIDLILTDIMLPGIDGNEFIRRIKNKSKVPIIAISANSLQSNIDEANEAGVDEFLFKPITKGKIRKVLKKYVQ